MAFVQRIIYIVIDYSTGIIHFYICMVFFQKCGTTEDSSIWFNYDREGILTFLFTELLLFYAFVLCEVILFPIVIVHVPCLRISQFLYFVLYFLCVYCHFLCVFTDPGAVPHNAHPLCVESVEEGELLIRCGICDAFKPTRSHHCKICNRCILKMDHHCPWINNCVGLMNLKFFLLLLGYSFLLCTNTCIFSCLSFLPITKYPYGVKKIVHMVATLIGIAFSSFFLLFVVILFSDALKTVFSGYSKIDRKKGVEARTISIRASLSEVFGGDGTFSLSWFIPTRPVFSNFDLIAGYVLDRSGERWNMNWICFLMKFFE